jgi:hypothetical protein
VVSYGWVNACADVNVSVIVIHVVARLQFCFLTSISLTCEFDKMVVSPQIPISMYVRACDCFSVICSLWWRDKNDCINDYTVREHHVSCVIDKD